MLRTLVTAFLICMVSTSPVYAEKLYLGSIITKKMIFGCSTLETSAHIFYAQKDEGVLAANSLAQHYRANAKFKSNPAKPYCVVLFDESVSIEGIPDLEAELPFPGNVTLNTMVLEAQRLKTRERLWIFINSTEVEPERKARPRVR